MTKDDIGLDPMAWTKAIIEWGTIYFFVGQKGKFRQDDVQRVFDGSLFFYLRDTQQPEYSSNGALTGVRMPVNKNLRWLEDYYTKLAEIAPSWESAVESRYQEFTLLVQRYAPQVWSGFINARANKQPLTGVAEPRSLFRKKKVQANDDTPVVLFPEGLTGVKPFVADNSTEASLTGVQGYHVIRTSEPENEGTSSTLTGIHGVKDQSDDITITSEIFTITGILRADDDIYVQGKGKDWLEIDHLAGVRGPMLSHNEPVSYEEIELVDEGQSSIGLSRHLKQEEVETIEIHSDASVPGLAHDEDNEDNEESQTNLNDEGNDLETRSETSSNFTHESPLSPAQETKKDNNAVVAKKLPPSEEEWPMLADAMRREE
ncbi:hypothetical protein DFQ28_003116 [Apophysomyces sp. BC1034]|nr:hypothetical protein DFQ30_005863 [Apophysomyces sp. BC1015]KAG0189658.1 hypothetical protein DFQ28_003116 [Apophysomyces sp. BC1034]